MENFEELIASETLVLVDFYATWCGPCKTMHPILEELKKIKGAALRIVKIDVDKNDRLASHWHVQSIPTMMLFRNSKMLWRQSGAMSLEQLKNNIAKYE